MVVEVGREKIRDMKVCYIKYRGRVFPAFALKCSRCGKINVELYPVKFFICEYCNAMVPVSESLQMDMIMYTKDMGDVTNFAPTEEWNTIKMFVLAYFSSVEVGADVEA